MLFQVSDHAVRVMSYLWLAFLVGTLIVAGTPWVKKHWQPAFDLVIAAVHAFIGHMFILTSPPDTQYWATRWCVGLGLWFTLGWWINARMDIWKLLSPVREQKRKEEWEAGRAEREKKEREERARQLREERRRRQQEAAELAAERARMAGRPGVVSGDPDSMDAYKQGFGYPNLEDPNTKIPIV